MHVCTYRKSKIFFAIFAPLGVILPHWECKLEIKVPKCYGAHRVSHMSHQHGHFCVLREPALPPCLELPAESPVFPRSLSHVPKVAEDLRSHLHQVPCRPHHPKPADIPEEGGACPYPLHTPRLQAFVSEISWERSFTRRWP